MSSVAWEIVARVYDLPGRSTRAIVDLDAITENVGCLHSNLHPGQELMAVVKANGYGHGAVMTARAALRGGANRLGVATVGEAAELRKSGISAPILILGPIDPSEVDRALEADAEMTIGSRSLLDAIAVRAGATGRVATVHVKVDTGMHRFGASPEGAVGLIQSVARTENVRLGGICTHLATADDPQTTLDHRQLALFREILDAVREDVTPAVAIHASNSAASVRGIFPEGTFDRAGIAIYGLQPGPRIDLLPGMRPSLSLISRLARVHEACPGHGLSYGQTYVAERRERIGLLPIGYGDGYRRAFSNRAWARLAGSACPVRGNVCMDQTMIGDLAAGAEEGDHVSLMGPILDGPSTEQVANWAETISYELVSGLGPRIPRYYTSGGEIVATLIEGTLELL